MSFLFLNTILFIHLCISTTFRFPGTYKPSSKRLLTSIKLTDEYTITFDFILYRQTITSWGSILALGNRGGERFPSLWVHKNDGYIHNCIVDSGSSNRCINQPTNIQINKKQTLKIVITQTSYKIYLNNVLKGNMAKAKHITNINKNLYIGVPWSTSANVDVIDLTIITKDNSPNTIKFPGLYKANSKKLMGSFKLANEFTISFDFKLYTQTLTSWGSVFAIGNKGGERFPSLWVHKNDGYLHNCIVDSGSSNRCINQPTNIPINIKHNLKIIITQTSYKVYLNNELKGNMVKVKHIININKNIYIGVPWSTSANIDIIDLTIVRGNKGVIGPTNIPIIKYISSELGFQNVLFNYGKLGQTKNVVIPPSSVVEMSHNRLGVCKTSYSEPNLDINVNISPNVMSKVTLIAYVNQRSKTPSGYGWVLSQDDGGFDRSLLAQDRRFGGVAAGIGRVYRSTLGELNLNEWTFIAATWNAVSKTTRIYKGTVKGGLKSQTLTNVVNSNGKPFVRLNSHPAANDHTLLGCIGDVRIFNKELTPTQITNQFNTFKSGSNYQPLIHYNRNDLTTSSRTLVNKGIKGTSGNAAITTGNTIETIQGITGVCVDNWNDQPIRINVDISPSKNIGLTMIAYILKKRESPNKYSWILSQDNGQYDRSILIQDQRYSGLAAGIGRTYRSILGDIELNKWTFVAITWNQNVKQAIIYKGNDKELYSDLVSGTSLGDGFSYLYLNGNPIGRNHQMFGCISDVKIFGYQLSDGEIRRQFDLMKK